MKKILLLAFALVGVLTLSAQDNKLMNSGFEEGTVKPKRGNIENGEWYKSNLPNSSIMPVVNAAYEGNKSLRFICNDKIDTRYKQFVAQRGLQLSQKKIEISFYARSAKSVVLNVSLVGVKKGGNDKLVTGNGENVRILSDNKWHLYTVEVDLESGEIISNKKSVKLNFDEPFELRIALDGGQDFSMDKTIFYIDNISVSEKI